MAPAPAALPPIMRNLTSTFIRFRIERKGGQRTGRLIGGGSDTLPEQRPLRGDEDARPCLEDIEMGALPPQWLESAQRARDDIRCIREKMKELAKAQNRRLLRVFGHDSSPDKDVETISSQISDLIRHCEQCIHQVKTRGGSGSSNDTDLRLNVQRSLASQLQGCSQEYRTYQKNYMAKIKERNRGSAGKSYLDAPLLGGEGFIDTGFNDLQLQEVETMEIDAQQRSAEILQIAQSISELHTIFKELAVLVIDQGSILDRIDYNIEQVVDQSREANVQLQKAERASKSNRAMRCMYCLVVANFILLLVLIIKSRR